MDTMRRSGNKDRKGLTCQWFWSLGFLLFSGSAWSQSLVPAGSSGDTDLFELRAKYAGAERMSRGLYEQGRIDEAAGMLLDVVPEEERTAMHHHLLGCVFFTLDRTLSRKFNGLACEQAPDDSETVRMWALECQRAGDAEAAERLHARQPEAFWDLNPAMLAARAANLVRLGRYEEARRIWAKAREASDDDGILMASWWIHGQESPERARGAMLARITGGETDALESLILADLEWRTGWNECVARDDLVRADLELAARLLGGKSDRVRQLELMARFHPRVEDLDGAAAGVAPGAKKRKPSGIEKELTTSKLLGPGARLPASSLVARSLYARIVSEQPARAKELLKAHGAALRKRIEAEAGDRAASDLLILLARAAKDPGLPALEQAGWDRHRSPECAAAVLARQADELSGEDPDLVRALAEFPEEPAITAIALACARREGRLSSGAAARHVVAVFRRPSDVSALDHAFDQLDLAVRLEAPGIQATTGR